MLFNSYIFILGFLPICVIGYLLLNHLSRYNIAKLFLIGMSLLFYGYFEPTYLIIIIISILGNFCIGRILQKKAQVKFLLGMAIIFNLGLLFYFKYFDFFLQNVNMVFQTDFAPRNIILPLGISFFTFQQLSYVIDTYRGETPQYHFLDYILFVIFFPQLIAGPIVSHAELIPQLISENNKKVNWENISKGSFAFVLGLSKKVLIADVFGNAANWGFANIELLDSTNAVICMLAFTIQIYFDFSGYCDMATGIAKMLNIDLPQNFNSPYKALLIIDFWKRWHLTMTHFFTKYVYIPMGGNRHGRVRKYFNMLFVFLLSGLWHGANWNFVVWGGLHGFALIITKNWKNFFDKLHPALNWMLTFSFLNVTWVFFKAKSLNDAVIFLNQIAVMDFGGINSNILSAFQVSEFKKILYNIPGVNLLEMYPYLLFGLYFIFGLTIILGTENVYEKMKTFRPRAAGAIVVAVLLVWCIFSLSGVSAFLYFNF